ncbi:MAG: PIG-L family deacetylase [Clostridia bacterium]|nr:PIG-L family deacetylase [Clostridia bacterium]
MRKKIFWLTVTAVLLCLLFCTAGAEEAADISRQCSYRTSRDAHGSYLTMTDGKYTTYWESKAVKHPVVTITSKEPIYGIYLCFQHMPDSFVLQEERGDSWKTLAQGDTRFHHSFYQLNGQKKIRIQADSEKNQSMGFNEIFVFGQGDIPSWVQQWEEPEKKADILFAVAHPDDELLFMGGAIPTYGTEMKKRIAVVYLTKSNTTRRSEALNGLWSMGIRHYPVFGEFADAYSETAADAYKKAGKNKVLAWMTALYRQYQPEAVVTHDLKGEYGHGQHRMMADACGKAFELAADPEKYPESAEQYGTWQVKKVYIHLYGEEAGWTRFDWNQPLSAFGGRTGSEVAQEAFELHKTQEGKGTKIRGKFQPFSVEQTGALFPNNAFGLFATTVGEDEIHTDFLEHIATEEDENKGSVNP